MKMRQIEEVNNKKRINIYKIRMMRCGEQSAIAHCFAVSVTRFLFFFVAILFIQFNSVILSLYACYRCRCFSSSFSLLFRFDGVQVTQCNTYVKWALIPCSQSVFWIRVVWLTILLSMLIITYTTEQ